MAVTRFWMTAIVLLTGGASLAHAEEGERRPVNLALTVRTYNTFGVAARDLWAAQTTASRLFADVGIRLVWMNCSTGGHRVASPRCDQPVDGAEVILRIDGASQPDQRENVSMGFALVDPSHGSAVLATVLADRVLCIARAAGFDPRVLLGLAMAHEIGHLLLPTAAHAATGVMRAFWSQSDLRRATPRDWQFLEPDARVMQGELMRRITHGTTARSAGE
jgi:hypothetical protein